MKKEFEIVITETRSATVTVKADDIDEALEIAEENYYDNAYPEEMYATIETTFEGATDYPQSDSYYEVTVRDNSQNVIASYSIFETQAAFDFAKATPEAAYIELDHINNGICFESAVMYGTKPEF